MKFVLYRSKSTNAETLFEKDDRSAIDWLEDDAILIHEFTADDWEGAKAIANDFKPRGNRMKISQKSLEICCIVICTIAACAAVITVTWALQAGL